MSKSFCSGCKHWVYIQASENNGKGFHYCETFSKWELKWRKLWCNGKSKERGTTMAEEVNIEEYQPHKVSEVICVKCCKRWIGVRPTQTRLKDLECPNCGAGYVIETGEVINENEQQ